MILIKFKNIGTQKELLVTNSKNNFAIGILTTYGAALNKFIYKNQNGFKNLMLGYQTESDFSSAYKNVILSPFCNRIKNGAYSFKGKNYQLPINRPTENNALHGFLYNKSFKVTEMKRGNDDCEIELIYEAKEEEGFPFKYNQKINYKWNGFDELIIECEIENKSETEMPYFLGWHPYFKIGDNVDDCLLQFEPKNKILVDEQKIPTGEIAEFKNFASLQKINNFSFDDAFEMNENKTSTPTPFNVLLKNETEKTSLKLEFLDSNLPYKYLQIYTPKDRKSIAIEPMTSFADALNHKKDLTILKATENRKSSFKIKLNLE